MSFLVVIWINKRKGLFFRFSNRAAAMNLEAEMKRKGYKSTKIYVLE